MKVMCIDGVKIGDIGYNVSHTRPAEMSDLIYEGETYTVSGSLIDTSGWAAYRLAEKSPFNMYKQCRFVPLSEINEKEISKQREHDTCKV